MRAMRECAHGPNDAATRAAHDGTGKADTKPACDCGLSAWARASARTCRITRAWRSSWRSEDNLGAARPGECRCSARIKLGPGRRSRRRFASCRPLGSDGCRGEGHAMSALKLSFRRIVRAPDMRAGDSRRFFDDPARQPDPRGRGGAKPEAAAVGRTVVAEDFAMRIVGPTEAALEHRRAHAGLRQAHCRNGAPTGTDDRRR